MLTAATPIPAVGVALSALVFFSALLSPRDRCGVDACGMAMAAAITLLFLAAMTFALGVVLAYLALKLASK